MFCYFATTASPSCRTRSSAPPTGISPAARARRRPGRNWRSRRGGAPRRSRARSRLAARAAGVRTRLVQCMWPGPGPGAFDLIAAPAHDRAPARRNLVRTVAAPHRVTPARLAAAEARWRGELAPVPRPRIALLVGGATKRRRFGAADAAALAGQVRALAVATGGGIMMATSRRTGAAAADRLAGALAPAHAWGWGGAGDNPYPGYLALADIVVVTGDFDGDVRRGLRGGAPRLYRCTAGAHRGEARAPAPRVVRPRRGAPADRRPRGGVAGRTLRRRRPRGPRHPRTGAVAARGVTRLARCRVCAHSRAPAAQAPRRGRGSEWRGES